MEICRNVLQNALTTLMIVMTNVQKKQRQKQNKIMSDMHEILWRRRFTTNGC